MTIEVPSSRLPSLPPQLEGQHALEGDFEQVRHLYGLLASVGGAEWQFGQALALLEWCRASGAPSPTLPPFPLPPPERRLTIESEWFTRRSWEMMAARDGALTIYHFGQALAAIVPAVRQCAAIVDHVDYMALRLARKSFKAAFPSYVPFGMLSDTQSISQRPSKNVTTTRSRRRGSTPLTPTQCNLGARGRYFLRVI
jgi:hypothetical protein